MSIDLDKPPVPELVLDEEQPVARSTATVRVSVRHRVLVLLLLVPAVFYSYCCLVYNAPSSPARVRLAGSTTQLMNPYFGQDWMLFAPTPATVNDLILMDVKLKPAGSTQVVTTAQTDIEAAIDAMPRGNRLFPSKLPGVMLAFNETFSNLANQMNQVSKSAPKDKQAAAIVALDKKWAGEFTELQRFLSVRAASMYPGATIISVRGTFETQAILPFSSRYQNPAPKEPVKGVIQTDWMPYTAGVAN
ncbi:DUF5819 family protein [Streptacidiphilus sp. PAMC 29251]